jgi:hypothetical protein
MIRPTRWTPTLGLLAALAACAEREPEPEVRSTDAADSAPESRATAVTAEDLAVWDVRFDDATSDPGGFLMTEAEGGWTIVTGPNGAGITWRPADLRQGGAFTASATMEEREAPVDHAEGYGLIVGGQNLTDPDQRYTYFLVRGTGHYLITRREGEATSALIDWTASDAVPKVTTAGGGATNALEVRVEPETTRFLVNGTEVAALPTERVQPYGLVGLRVNHALDVVVRDFRVDGGAAPAGGAPGGAASGAASGTYPEGRAPDSVTPEDAAR